MISWEEGGSQGWGRGSDLRKDVWGGGGGTASFSAHKRRLVPSQVMSGPDPIDNAPATAPCPRLDGQLL